MKKLFGTDGIRGKVGTYPMTLEIALKLGNAVASFFKNRNDKIVIAKDTRVSNDMIEAAVCAGITEAGIDVHIMGVLPTPALAFLTHYTKANSGIMISASHNPYYDNGIKIFNQDGFKLSDKEEEELEALILSDKRVKKEISGKIYHIDNSEEPYINFLKSSTPLCLQDLKIVIDCANGSNSEVAPKLFKELNANLITINNIPNGININDNCGSEHTQNLSKRVIKESADIGFAFDGDADRLIVVDNKGERVDGDILIFLFADFAKKKSKLKNNSVVTTVMSNIGLRKALEKNKIKHITANVGDRYVMQDMKKNGSTVGGENSGHLIFLDKHTTGDGLYAALKTLEIIIESRKKISELSKAITLYPQTLLNVEVSKKEPLEKNIHIKKTIEEVEKTLEESGRVLVRFSGTQNICRVMVEAKTQKETQFFCERIAEVIKRYM